MTTVRKDPPLLDLLGEHRHMLLETIPHAQALKLSLVDIAFAEATIKLPYAPELVGNPDTGVLHGGVITTLLDNVSGVAVFCRIEEPTSTATLDLRIDYMRPAEPGRDVLGHAHCYKLTTNIAFVRGTAYEESPGDPIATSTGAFMIGSSGDRMPAAKQKRQDP